MNLYFVCSYTSILCHSLILPYDNLKCKYNNTSQKTVWMLHISLGLLLIYLWFICLFVSQFIDFLMVYISFRQLALKKIEKGLEQVHLQIINVSSWHMYCNNCCLTLRMLCIFSCLTCGLCSTQRSTALYTASSSGTFSSSFLMSDTS